ncbi:hypothetical protein V8F20_002919 [Naviculisporaceae sp. PSN 640]
MSFGWSAGDIAATIKLARRVYEALDSCHGAPREYREATSFLKELTQALEPLRTFATWGAYPVYGKEIADRVAFIKGPVENLLAQIVKLEPKLGIGSESGFHRHVLPKLKWHFVLSKRVLELRAQIECHMRVLDTLLQRLTLDIVSRTQLTLPDVFFSVFQERIRPELIATLREIMDAQQRQSHRRPEINISYELYADLVAQIEDLKRVTASLRDSQLQFERLLRFDGRLSAPRQETIIASSNPDTVTARNQMHLPWMTDQFYKLLAIRTKRIRKYKSKVAPSDDGNLPDWPDFMQREGCYTQSYRAPETEANSSTFSSAYDIYTLALVALEFIAWIIVGEEEEERFCKLKTAGDIPVLPYFRRDKFYTLSQDARSAT